MRAKLPEEPACPPLLHVGLARPGRSRDEPLEPWQPLPHELAQRGAELRDLPARRDLAGKEIGKRGAEEPLHPPAGKPVLTATELAVAFPDNAGPAAVRASGRLCYPSANRAVAALEHMWRYARRRARGPGA